MFNIKKLTGSILFLFATHAGMAQQTSPVDFVNPLIGTESKYELSNGNTYPAIARPWGMNFWTPQTGNMGDGWVYTYTADKIKGFKQTHQPSPWNNDYGQFSIMPITGTPLFDQEKRASWFSHKAEIAKPYYYSVYLADHDVTTELSPSQRAAIFQFTFPKTDSAYVIIDAFDKGSYIKVIPQENKIIGYSTKNSGGVPENFKNYFVITFDRPFSYKAAVKSGAISKDELEIQDNHAGAVVGFSSLKRGEKVTARIASSFISFEQAELNLKEVKSKTFQQVVDEGKAQWNEILGRVQVEDHNIDRLRTFYSSLYRSTLFPRDFSEIDGTGKRMHYSPYNGQVLPGEMFTDTGFWDTFRSLFPLLNLLYPSMNDRMQEGLVNAYKESGYLPEWASPGHRASMIGNNSASIVADALITDRKGYDKDLLWEALKHGANSAYPKHSSTGRFGYEYYNKLGYIPADVKVDQNVARSLEYAYNDWCIYEFGKALGKPEAETAIYATRAMNYKNLFDPSTKLMRGKKADGSFVSDFDPSAWSREYTEGNAWHWSFCVFHDPQGLINLMGGNKSFVSMLDTVFVIPSYEGMKSRGMIHEMREMQVMNMGQYAHGNQPIQHMPYLYNYAAEPWKAQYWVRKIMDKLYLPTPDGYCGDEDNGQTSAWYVFSSLGFYPVSPASGEYVIGSPQFDKVTLNFENGKKVNIQAKQQGANQVYVDQLTWNGKPYNHNYIRYKDLLQGAKLDFKMSEEPNKNRGTKKEDAPYSFSNEKIK
ncbi:MULTISPECIES: GH92 family glycosyl hydrolase [Sphingobacterium]|uniref:Alpha-mannosidase n=1 Tax=Sphingobacterium multivorum TaxID=28454 RepID=A0A654BFQ9_SPHMU|nr:MULTISPECIES: GH92 family glycosyl hydrolase [Sphingobacterium]HAE68865.1 alpha-mannosidase [Sphingobacterium sp.]QQT43711.1 GH92 family glycosyl hydrolase [Sphingobacterium multivorum]SUJ04685.1 Putative alpha-1,2-mannosidase [Sphingobacterium multivorum]VXC78618.1 Alpha-mannosidase [Sphingobacterium multivorum]HAU52349.1 alpha-mannosidase [Sphingobacterium sp.]